VKRAILEVDNLYKSFARCAVLNGVSFQIPEGEISSVIGPNGAGKTTLFNVITGLHAPSKGSISFNGRNIAGLKPWQIVPLGIAKAFQITSIFPRLTVWENILGAVITHRRKNQDMITPLSKLPSIHERAEELLDSVGLTDYTDTLSGTLAHGNQKRLDIALALALSPKLLLLDEPTAGMSPEERAEVVTLIKNLWEQLDITMLFIEHDMDIVFGISQTVRVLCYGVVIAEGTPDEISRNTEVIKVYLGEGD